MESLKKRARTGSDDNVKLPCDNRVWPLSPSVLVLRRGRGEGFFWSQRKSLILTITRSTWRGDRKDR